jgi:hypothetical protein
VFHIRPPHGLDCWCTQCQEFVVYGCYSHSQKPSKTKRETSSERMSSRKKGKSRKDSDSHKHKLHSRSTSRTRSSRHHKRYERSRSTMRTKSSRHDKHTSASHGSHYSRTHRSHRFHHGHDHNSSAWCQTGTLRSSPTTGKTCIIYCDGDDDYLSSDSYDPHTTVRIAATRHSSDNEVATQDEDEPLHPWTQEFVDDVLEYGEVGRYFIC